ncbi:uncharacterized protein Nmag_3898 (plasmid) [Natrialba magadii ATCC 43099]|uniref:Uncharacterized protein n=1 Tax=Natrialba magadii (strain ATCC 43099 / DSM 3394 / CCM 3739 / CIP 104546 / IAM 13178 / JCM 8861 / NBRC 102185 / NCIMB 2190 / MS3) TaxID=547559 RepID=D3T1I0_NATMM|nr:hypothetical protein [Natrialba magadii]ADD07439.1 uncharacterized protein Nmag_3898 [Natrialba magadii ATCC 43099]ELY32247.1 hypothetical protein C500_04194 [Natrialba magadii ATCC 43099]
MSKDNPLRRRTVLAAAGASATAGLTTVAAARNGDQQRTPDETESATRHLTVEVERYGDRSPAAVVPDQFETLADDSQSTINTAIETGRTTRYERPWVRGTGFVVDDEYYQYNVSFSGRKTREAPVLVAESVDGKEPGTDSITSIDEFTSAAWEAIHGAIGRERYLHLLETETNTSVDDTMPRQRGYVFGASENVPTQLAGVDFPHYVQDETGDYYRLSLRSTQANVAIYHVRTESVAKTAAEFDEWFSTEQLVLDDQLSLLSTQEQDILTFASEGGITEKGEPSEAVTQFLKRIGIDPAAPLDDSRWARIGPELLFIDITTGVGC